MTEDSSEVEARLMQILEPIGIETALRIDARPFNRLRRIDWWHQANTPVDTQEAKKAFDTVCEGLANAVTGIMGLTDVHKETVNFWSSTRDERANSSGCPDRLDALCELSSELAQGLEALQYEIQSEIDFIEEVFRENNPDGNTRGRRPAPKPYRAAIYAVELYVLGMGEMPTCNTSQGGKPSGLYARKLSEVFELLKLGEGWHDRGTFAIKMLEKPINDKNGDALRMDNGLPITRFTRLLEMRRPRPFHEAARRRRISIFGDLLTD